MSSLPAFLPELVLLTGALALFGLTLGGNTRQAKLASLATAAAFIAAVLFSFRAQAVLFNGAYRVDAFSQLFKLVVGIGYVLVLLLGRGLDDIREDIRAEYYLFLSLGLCGLTFLFSSIELITIVVSLELSSFPLYLMVAMRRERDGQRVQMESAIKYMMFGIAANGIMFFGLSYLFGLTGTTSLPLLVTRLQPVLGNPLAIVGLALSFAGILYKLAVFPFHFWTPDVYQGASNETAGLVASLPKLGAIAVLTRFVGLAAPGDSTIPMLLAVLATASMCYGNFVALVQDDVKRLLGFSGIAHAGYALLGFVALGQFGFAASIFYIAGYVPMVLACFLVVSRVSADGANVSLSDLAGLHRRSPLLALTLALGVFALAGIPPFVGFMGKFYLINAALAKGWLWLVIVTVINSAIAIYYYLRIVKEAYFSDTDRPAIALDAPAKFACVALLVGITALGVAPSKLIDLLATSLTTVDLALK
ncbi:MAG TPA: NADH-quinone oxidoreductase subunit N [Opitutaceae bacterium]|nr:NADH-quinone oxidoreductase subunit N [Opitutaceae bacterium]